MKNRKIEVHYIPLTNASSPNIFSKSRFIGWPSESNAYADDAPCTQASSIILSNIVPINYLEKNDK